MDAPKLNRSLWLETAEPRYSRLAANIDVDVAIVGAGITGGRHGGGFAEGGRRGDDRVLTATAFAKWGMTKGTLADEILADAVLGRPNEWAELYDAKRLDVRRSAARFAKENGSVGLRFLRDRLRARDSREDVDRLAPGEGTILRVGAKQVAVARDDDGTLRTLSARCTHLGCIVGWNPADRAWECPCHGSRFAVDGTVVQGPATADLPRRALPD